MIKIKLSYQDEAEAWAFIEQLPAGMVARIRKAREKEGVYWRMYLDCYPLKPELDRGPEKR